MHKMDELKGFQISRNLSVVNCVGLDNGYPLQLGLTVCHYICLSYSNKPESIDSLILYGSYKFLFELKFVL